MLMMAGSQAKQIMIKTPRGQTWPAETQTSEATNAGPAARQRAIEPARQREPSHRHRQKGSGNQTVMTKTATTTAEMWMSQRLQTRGRFQPIVEIRGTRMQGS